MPSARIVGLAVLAAVAYGIVHDQVTARVCVEYFTIGHARIFDTESPTLLGLGWGVMATWRAGLGLGLPLAVAARAGRRPKRDARSRVRPIAVLLGLMAVSAASSGLVGYRLARAGVSLILPPLVYSIPEGRRAGFQADLFAHEVSYAVGFLGGLVVIGLVWRSRRRAEAQVTPPTGGVGGAG